MDRDIPMPVIRNSRIASWAVCITPMLIYAFLAYPLRGWITDDAGISFAYARNLATGFGLVSQPGVPPVEGYSNPLWVFLMSIAFKLRVFHLYATPKILSFILVGLSFAMISRLLLTFVTRSFWIISSVLVSLAINASFVIWTTSGLENALYLFLMVSLFSILASFVTDTNGRNRQALFAGLIAGAIGITRPEGAVYVMLFPITRPMLKTIAVYMAGFTLIFGGHLLFRWLYFGNLYPNTYYAKGGPTWTDLWPALRLQGDFGLRFWDLMSGYFGARWRLIPAVGVFLGGAGLCIQRRSRPFLVLLWCFSFLATYLYVLLPLDWMGEFRFATLSIVWAYVTMGALIAMAFDRMRDFRFARYAPTLATAAVVGFTVREHLPRFQQNYSAPTVPFANVASLYGHTFNRLADRVSVQRPSLLLPDVGGTLYESKLRIYDLGMLCDREIARTLEKDLPSFHDYIFEKARPTFIHTHGSWTWRAKFEEDPRFRRDYLAIREWPDKWILKNFNQTMHSGDFVRRDATPGDPDMLKELREILEKP